VGHLVGGDLRLGEDGRGDVAEPERLRGLTERVPHRYPALIAATDASIMTPVRSPAG